MWSLLQIEYLSPAHVSCARLLRTAPAHGSCARLLCTAPAHVCSFSSVESIKMPCATRDNKTKCSCLVQCFYICTMSRPERLDTCS